MRTRLLLTGVGAVLVAGVVLLPAAPASAHPLGNFSINEYVGLTLRPDRVEAQTVVDVAEIPTLQDRPAVDSNGDDIVTPAEQASYATRTCADVSHGIEASVDGSTLQWTVGATSYGYAPGAGGLDVSRLTCALTAPATLDGPARLSIRDGYLADRVGWREMTAVGTGVELVDSPLPATSVTGELRNYPKDLLSSPLNVRSATIATRPGFGHSSSAAAPTISAGGDPFSRAVAALDRRFADLAAGRLTLWVGLLAGLLAVLLGAGHAALPGHGKTVMAAYLAGKRGRPRDALLIAGTVTLTHTGGVLALGVLLTAGSALAGDQILGWLGIASGVIVLGVGVSMVVGLWRKRRHHHLYGQSEHHHDHSHDHHHHDHDHDHGTGTSTVDTNTRTAGGDWGWPASVSPADSSPARPL